LTRRLHLEPRLAWRWTPFVLAILVLADQLLKAAVVHATGRLPLTLIGSVRVDIVHNTGISFSRFTGGGDALLAAVALVTVLVAVLLVLLPRRYSPALVLILGGSIGNLIDRVRLGYVIDYLGISVWPTFNLADVAIVGGALLFAVRLLTAERG
jgi:signal peptidase II